jgi:hypothetical protein
MQVKVSNRVPCPSELYGALEVVPLLFATMWDSGSAALWFSFALVLRVMWHALLRPGEAFQLAVGSVRVSTCYATKATAVLMLENPKTRAFLGRNQVGLIDCPASVSFVRWMIEDMPTGALLWPYSRARFRTCLNACLRYLDVPVDVVSAASFRAGRATHLFTSGVPVPTIKYLGRWKSENSMAAYIQEAAAASVMIQLGTHVSLRLERFTALFAFLRQHPRRSHRSLLRKLSNDC